MHINEDSHCLHIQCRLKTSSHIYFTLFIETGEASALRHGPILHHCPLSGKGEVGIQLIGA